MKNTMKKGIFLLAFAVLVAGGAFAQRVGDTVQVSGQSWRVQELNNGRMVLQLVPSLDGVWVNSGNGNVITINGSTGVITTISPNALWQDAISKGYVKVGDQVRRNITSSGNLRWTCQALEVTYGSNRNVAISTRWADSTFTLSADGQSLSESGGVAYTRRQ